MEFDQKKIREIDLFDFTSFLAWTFLKFSRPLCVYYQLKKCGSYFIREVDGIWQPLDRIV